MSGKMFTAVLMTVAMATGAFAQEGHRGQNDDHGRREEQRRKDDEKRREEQRREDERRREQSRRDRAEQRRRDERRGREEQRRYDERHGAWSRGKVIEIRIGNQTRHRYTPNHGFYHVERRREYIIVPYVTPWEVFVFGDLDRDRYAPYKIASTRLDHSEDFDLIDIDQYDPRNCVKAVKIRVLENEAEIDRLVMHFKNGQDQEIEYRKYYPANSGDYRWTNVQQWNGNNNCIDSISVLGKTTEYGHQAKVEIWAYK